MPQRPLLLKCPLAVSFSSSSLSFYCSDIQLPFSKAHQFSHSPSPCYTGGVGIINTGLSSVLRQNVLTDNQHPPPKTSLMVRCATILEESHFQMFNRPTREQIVLGEFRICMHGGNVLKRSTNTVFLRNFTGNVPSQCSNTPRNGSWITCV